MRAGTSVTRDQQHKPQDGASRKPSDFCDFIVRSHTHEQKRQRSPFGTSPDMQSPVGDHLVNREPFKG